MKNFIMVIKTWYKNKYSFSYIIDALTGRQLKNRVGKCLKNCGLCCRYKKDLSFCKEINLKTKKCNIYNKRKCNTEFPVNQEELNHFYKIFPDFKCGYSFRSK